MPVLRCDGLRKSFGGVRALADFSCDFHPSCITAIIGPNGAGKTTLLNVVTGLSRAEAGRCFLGSREITHLSACQIARLGVARTFQEVRLIFQVSTLENALLARPCQRGENLLAMLLRFRMGAEEAGNRDVAMSLLRFVGLEEKHDELAGELSYGEQKLLTLVCCLATEARILLLDEPVAGAGPEMTARILEFLQQIRDQGKVIVIVEHNIAAVRQIADRVVVMDEGRIISEGPCSNVLERPEILEAYLG